MRVGLSRYPKYFRIKKIIIVPAQNAVTGNRSTRIVNKKASVKIAIDPAITRAVAPTAIKILIKISEKDAMSM